MDTGLDDLNLSRIKWKVVWRTVYRVKDPTHPEDLYDARYLDPDQPYTRERIDRPFTIRRKQR
jgi:hypothetical protein